MNTAKSFTISMNLAREAFSFDAVIQPLQQDSCWVVYGEVLEVEGSQDTCWPFYRRNRKTGPRSLLSLEERVILDVCLMGAV